MRVRTPDRERSRTATGSGATTASRLWGLAHHLLTAVGLLTVTYAVLRVLGPRDDVPVQSVDEAQAEMEAVLPDEIRSRASDAVPGGRSVDTIRNRVGGTVPDDITQTTIEGPQSEESELDPGVEPSSETDEGDSENAPEPDETSDDVLDETATNADYIDDERSDAEIAERADPDTGTEPTEPGEMAVDEDVAETVDDETDADEPEE